MTINTKNENGTLTLQPEGWLDSLTSPELELAVAEASDFTALVLDFDKLEYISSAGLRVVVSAFKKAKDNNAEFSVTHVCSEIMNIFEMTKLNTKLNVIPKE